MPQSYRYNYHIETWCEICQKGLSEVFQTDCKEFYEESLIRQIKLMLLHKRICRVNQKKDEYKGVLERIVFGDKGVKS